MRCYFFFCSDTIKTPFFFKVCTLTTHNRLSRVCLSQRVHGYRRGWLARREGGGAQKGYQRGDGVAKGHALVVERLARGEHSRACTRARTYSPRFSNPPFIILCRSSSARTAPSSRQPRTASARATRIAGGRPTPTRCTCSLAAPACTRSRRRSTSRRWPGSATATATRRTRSASVDRQEV